MPGACADTREEELRCLCGSLIARLVEGGVELRCRRCKRLVVVPLQEGGAADPDLR